MTNPILSCCVLTLGLIISANAEPDDNQQPIYVTAGQAERNQKSGESTLENQVHLRQGSLEMLSDKAYIKEYEAGYQWVRAEGKPVKFKQRLQHNGEWLFGESSRLEYNSKLGVVKLIGDAWLKRGQDEVHADFISYNTITEFYTADSDKHNKNRVNFIIAPKPAAKSP